MMELPIGWTRAKLGDLVAINPRKFDRAPADDDLISLVPMAAVEAETGRIDSSEVVAYGEAKKRSLTPFQEGDVLFAKVTPCMENGKIAVAEKLASGRALGSTELFALRPTGAIDPRFLTFFLLQNSIREAARQQMTGAVGLRRVPRQYLEGVMIPVPPLSEQLRIVSALETRLSRLDAAAALLKVTRRRTAGLRNFVLDNLVQGKLWSLGQGLRRQDSSAELKGRVAKRVSYDSLPSLPDGWKWRVAADVCSRIVAGSTPAASLMHADSGEIPFLKVYNLKRSGEIDFSIRPTYVDRSTHEKLLGRSCVRPGDVLTNIVGPPLGKTVVVPPAHEEWNINQAIVAFRAADSILPRWLALALQSPLILQMLQRTAKATAGQFNIALSTCRELPLPVPPIEEQSRLVDMMDAMSARIAAAQSLSENSLGLARRLRESILAEAFAGRLVPQDPDDDPAADLLARIQAERAASLPQNARRVRSKWELPAPPTRSINDDYEQEALPL